MAALTYLPSYASRGELKAKVTARKFGDGYAQRSRKGSNAMRRIWNLIFADMSIAAAAPVFGFFETHSTGAAFDWTPPLGPAGRWTCTEYSQDPNGFDKRTIVATLVEDFNP